MRFLILIAALCSTLAAYSQNEPYVIEWPEDLPLYEPLEIDNTYHYTAIDKVVFNPGFSFEPNVTDPGIEKMEAYLDNSIVTSATQTYAPFPDADQAYQIDTSLPVGSIEGAINVTHNGSSSFALELALPEGINGMAPIVGVVYDSNAGNGPLGVGWGLSGSMSAITRMNRNYFQNGVVRSIELDETDALGLNGAQLVRLSGNQGQVGSVYCPENSLSARITTIQEANGAISFEARYKDGSTAYFGSTDNSRVQAQTDDTKTLIWSLQRVEDQFGNYMEFEYVHDGGSTRISRINYTGNSNESLAPLNSVEFIYAERSDPITSYLRGSKSEMNHLLKEIRMRTGSLIYNSYEFSYSYSDFSYLTGITKKGSNGTALNPMKFYYGDEAQDESVSSDYNPNGTKQVVSTADFNNDGYGDILQYTGFSSTTYPCGTGSDSEFTPTYTTWEILTGDGTGAFSTYASGPLTSMMLPMDYNGDGQIDFVSAEITISGYNPDAPNFNCCSEEQLELLDQEYSSTPGGWTFASPDGGLNFVPNPFGFNFVEFGEEFDFATMESLNFTSPSSFMDFISNDLHDCVSFDPMYELLRVDVLIAQGDGTFDESELVDLGSGEACSPSNFITTGDFVGDGKQDVLLIYGLPEDETEPANNVEVYTFTGTNSAQIESVQGALKDELSFAKNLRISDFNGNGKTDIVVTPGENSEFTRTNILELQDQNGWVLEPQRIYETEPGEDFFLNEQIGHELTDLNGDGKTDVILRNKTTNSYSVLYSNGLEYEPEVELDVLNNLDQNIPYCNLKILEKGDFNADGFPDLIVIEKSPTNATCPNGKHVIYGRGNSLSAPVSINLPIDEEDIFGDFNGDGSVDWITKTGSTDLHTLHKYSFENLLHHIDNGFGNRTSFEYEYSSSDNFLKSGGTGDETDGIASIRPYSNPIRAVRTMHYPTITGGTTSTEYRYSVPLAHTKGRGFLGFKFRSSYDHNTGIKVTTQNRLNPTSETFQTELTTAYKFEDVSNALFDLLISTSRTDEINSGGLSGLKTIGYDKFTPKRIFDFPKKLYSKDARTRSETITENTYNPVYDDNGDIIAVNIELSEVKVGAYQFSLGEEIETITIDNEFNEPGSWWEPHAITKVTTSKERHTPGAGPAYTRTKDIEYNENGSIHKETDDDGTTLEVTTEYLEYDEFGYPLLVKTSSSGLNDVENSITMDNSHRFVKTATNDLNETSSYERHPLFGTVTKETDHIGLITHYFYDEFGIRNRTVNPLGLESS